MCSVLVQPQLVYIYSFPVASFCLYCMHVSSSSSILAVHSHFLGRHKKRFPKAFKRQISRLLQAREEQDGVPPVQQHRSEPAPLLFRVLIFRCPCYCCCLRKALMTSAMGGWISGKAITMKTDAPTLTVLTLPVLFFFCFVFYRSIEGS